jgi:hypothetical protein
MAERGHAFEFGDFACKRTVLQLVVTSQFQSGFNVSGKRKRHGEKLYDFRKKTSPRFVPAEARIAVVTTIP